MTSKNKNTKPIVVCNWKKKRKRSKKHDMILQNWHTNDVEYMSREWKLIHGLSGEANFNDEFVNSIVTEDPELLCFQIG